MKNVLFLEKVFLKRKDGPVRGVEIFNLNLIRDLASLGIPITVPAHVSWRGDLEQLAQRGPVHCLYIRVGGGPLPAGLAAAARLTGRRFDVLVQGNVATGLIPAVSLIRRLRGARRSVLIAHREPFPRFLRAQPRAGTTVLAVNGVIAAEFREAGFEDARVYYGVTDADRYFPGEPPSRKDGVVRFCVIGRLDNAWKGSDWACRAYAGLPESLRARCELHLASFDHPPADCGKGVHAYPWMPMDRIAEFLRGMDVLLAPSRDEQVMRETFCQALVQGMLTGLPSAVNDLPVLTEKLDRGGGLVFRDAEGCGAAMQRLAADEALRKKLGAEGRATALARYVWNTSDFVSRFLWPGEGI